MGGSRRSVLSSPSSRKSLNRSESLWRPYAAPRSQFRVKGGRGRHADGTGGWPRLRESPCVRRLRDCELPGRRDVQWGLRLGNLDNSICALPCYRVTVLPCSGTAYPSFLGGYRHEVLVELCRTLGSCHPVNDITGRHGGVAKRTRRRNTAFHHHDRSAEACGEATADGKTGAGGNRCISPGSANPSNATASARFSPRKDCSA